MKNTDTEDFCLDIRIDKKKLSTQNPWVVTALLSALKQEYPFDWANRDTVVSKEIREDVERYNTARMKFATELYSHFFDQNLPKSQRGRKSFIGKFLYLADFIKDERYWYGCKPTLKRFCKKYEIAQYPRIMVEGTEHIAIPFDVGKDLADRMERPLCFDPFGQTGFAPVGHNIIDPCKVLVLGSILFYPFRYSGFS